MINHHLRARPQQQLSEAVLVVWITLAAVTVAGRFLYLDTSSLWLDELFTAYFADPNQTGFGAFLSRVAEDVHPPGYYVVVWLTARASGLDITIAARGVSAAFGAATILALYWTLPNWVGRSARLFGVALAATSITYYFYAQEARSYAMSWLILVLLIAIAFRIKAAFANGKPATVLLAVLLVVATIASLTHYYLILISGAIVASLILFAPNWTNRIAAAVTGLLILIPAVAFVGWHAPQIVATLADTWFAADLGWLWRMANRGFQIIVGSTFEKSLAMIIAAAALLSAVWIRRATNPRFDLRAAVADIAFLIVIALLAIALAIAVTLLYSPVFSFRFLILLAPVYWLVMACFAELMFRSGLRLVSIPLAIIATAVFAFSSSRLLWADIPTKQPWRETAAAVAAIPACDGATLPVVTFDTRYISDEEADRFYGFYLPQNTSRQWLAVPESAVADFGNFTPASELMDARLRGQDPCPVLLWSVNHANAQDIDSALESLKNRIAADTPAKVSLETVSLPASSHVMRLLSMMYQEDGYLIVVQR